MLRLILVCLCAGSAAGIGTGFAGLSASTVISPMLIAFMGYPWYESVGIGLASDVLASAFSAAIYRKNKNIDLKHGMLMVVSVLFMTVVGSYFSQYMPDTEMGWFTVVMSTFMGIRFIIQPDSKSNQTILLNRGKYMRNVMTVVCGSVIGFYCGFMGVGGGLMMLFILTCILGYELKVAVGTSVFVMTFTAMTGATSHFYFGDISSYIPALILCSFFTLLGAVITSCLANHMEPSMTKRATGVTLLVLGIGMIWEML